jgi:hypothetical protein
MREVFGYCGTWKLHLSTPEMYMYITIHGVEGEYYVAQQVLTIFAVVKSFKGEHLRRTPSQEHITSGNVCLGIHSFLSLDNCGN